MQHDALPVLGDAHEAQPPPAVQDGEGFRRRLHARRRQADFGEVDGLAVGDGDGCEKDAAILIIGIGFLCDMLQPIGEIALQYGLAALQHDLVADGHGRGRDVDVTRRAVRDGRLSRRILAARAEFRQGAHFLAVDAEHIFLFPAAFRKIHALVKNRGFAEGLRLVRHELKRRARARRGERHREKSQSRARVCDSCGRAKCTAAPSENAREDGGSRSAREDERGDFSDACESCRRHAHEDRTDESLWQRCLTLAIVQQGANCHRKQHTDGERQTRLGVEARVDGGGIAAKPCEKRHRHADEYDDGEKGQGETAEQEEEFAASMRGIRGAFGELSRTPDEERKPRQHCDCIDGDEPETDARAAERMHGEIA